MKFPKRVNHRGRTFATIYDKSAKYPSYRVVWNMHGKRHMKAFAHLGGKDGATEYAESLAKDLAKGSQAPALTSTQASDALAAYEMLERFRAATGKRYSLVSLTSEFIDAASKLGGHSLHEALEGFLRTAATVKRKNLAEGVQEFVASLEPRTKAKHGERAQLSEHYVYVLGLRLTRFADTFPNSAICDLNKEHLETFFRAKPLADFSPKTRNHFREAIRLFLGWATRKDYVSPTHRLCEADQMRVEHANTAEVEFYTPKEFRLLLETAAEDLRPVVAVAGLAGLRLSELLQLTWEDVWRIDAHVEVSRTKSKTRQRRLVEMVPSLKLWLEPYRGREGKVWAGDPSFGYRANENAFHKRLNSLCEAARVKRKDNALRHSFCTYHFAAYSNEGLTAAQAGNSPAMIHAHYKGLATKAEAEAWFAVAPGKAANIIPLANAVGQK